MPAKLPDARDDLPKQRPCQATFSELQSEVPGMSDEPTAGLEQPLLETREGPALNGDRQDQPTPPPQATCRGHGLLREALDMLLKGLDPSE
jgi:hypothetical protein